MKKVDVFDFDKTIYRKDSSLQFYFYCIKVNKKIIKHFPMQLFSFIKYKLGVISKDKFKEKFFSFVNSVENIDLYIKNFWELNKYNIRYNLLKNSQNFKIVISASPEFLLKDICFEIGIDILIATKVDKTNGRFNSPNCYGKEKVVRLQQELSNIVVENFYSDSKSDIHLAKLAKNSFLVKCDDVQIWKINNIEVK